MQWSVKHFSTSERQKAVRTPQFFTLLTWKCASRHNGVHFCHIRTSTNGLRVVCFVHFDLEMCFAPQRCDIRTSKSGLRIIRRPQPTARGSASGEPKIFSWVLFPCFAGSLSWVLCPCFGAFLTGLLVLG